MQCLSIFLVRVNVVEDNMRIPGGKGLVQPDIVPPNGGDQVAEPLMSQFMGMGGKVAALLVNRGIFIQQNQLFPIGDCPGVLHSPGGKIGYSDNVQFCIGVGRVKVLLQTI